MKRNNRLALATLSFFLLGAQSSWASFSLPSGWFLEGNIGESNACCKSYGTGDSTGSTNGLAWNINGGFKFIPYFALEAGVTSFANVNIDNAAGQQYGVDRRWAYDVAGRGIVPISDSGFELFGKAGVSRFYSSPKINNPGNNTSGYSASKQSATALLVGAGVDYMILPTLALNGQWQYFKGNNQTGKMNLYTGGLTWTVY